MDLADRIIAKQQNGTIDSPNGGTYYDDNGMPCWLEDMEHPEVLWDDPNYVASNIMVRSILGSQSGKAELIYKKAGELYEGHEILLQNDANLYRLSKAKKNIKAFVKPQVWKRVYELAPTLNEDKVIVAPGLIWDFKTGKLEKTDGEELSVRRYDGKRS